MKPLMIGIAGGTGSGKTTAARAVAAGLPETHVTILEHDSYYRDRSHMTPAERDALNFDHPESLETELLIQHLAELRAGKEVDIPIYDFATHTRKKETRRVRPTPVVLLEGILVFVEPALCQLLDIRIFVDTDADVRVLRRIRRDIEERGRTLDSVVDQYFKTVRPMHNQFVEPSKRAADLILPESANMDVAIGVILARLRAGLS